MKNLALNKTTRGFDLPQYRLNCTKFGKFIFMKIIKIVAIRCHILKLKCTKFDFGWGRWGASGPLAGFKGLTSKGTEGREKELRKGLKDKWGKGSRRRQHFHQISNKSHMSS